MQCRDFLPVGRVTGVSKEERSMRCWEQFISSEAKIYLWGILLKIQVVDSHLSIALNFFRIDIQEDWSLMVYLLKISIQNLCLGTRLLLFFLYFDNVFAHNTYSVFVQGIHFYCLHCGGRGHTFCFTYIPQTI